MSSERSEKKGLRRESITSREKLSLRTFRDLADANWQIGEGVVERAGTRLHGMIADSSPPRAISPSSSVSTIVTPQLPVENFLESLPVPVFCETITDRIVQR